MWSIAKPLTATRQQISQEQERAFRMGFLLGAKDALQICKVTPDGDLDGELAADLLLFMDRRLDMYAAELSARSAHKSTPEKKAPANQEKFRGELRKAPKYP